ncbi:protein NinF [Escherichia coli]
MKTMADHNCAELMSDPNSSMNRPGNPGD